MLSRPPRIGLPRKHLVGCVSHKGDGGHDGAEPVGSVGRGGGARGWAAGPGPGLLLRLSGPESRGFWTLLRGTGRKREERGAPPHPEEPLCHVGGRLTGAGVPGAGPMFPEANGNPAFPGRAESPACPSSGLESLRCRVSALTGPRGGSWGAPTHFFTRETELSVI